MKFETSENIDKWVKEHNCNAVGEYYEFHFIPQGGIERQSVKCLICGKEFIDYVKRKQRCI